MSEELIVTFPRTTFANASNASTIEIPIEEIPVQAVAIEKKPSVDPFLVQFDPDDPVNPQSWSRLRRWYITIAGGLLVFNATFASSAPSGIIQQLTSRFHMSKEVGVLAVSLFVAGYCVGPILWAPLSERYGRRPIFLISFLVYTGTQVGSALARNTATVLVFRFLGGLFAACPLSNSGALISDMWDAKTRGNALAIFAVMPFAGPALGPAVAGFIGERVDWRWVFWVLTIFAGLCFVLIALTIPETYGPIILAQKAKEKRKVTGDNRYYAAIERDRPRAGQLVNKVLARPFLILFQEPMLIAMTVYICFAFGCLYLFFEAYPIVFNIPHHLSAGIAGLMFLPIAIGGTFAVIIYVFVFNPRYAREVQKYAPNPVPPEFRLEMTIIAGPIFAASFFWFGWTSFPSISLWAPMMAGVPIGFSISWIFLSLFNYIIDAYLSVAASAIAASIICRSVAGAVFPLFADAMYDKLGARWASSLLGFFALAMIPIPFVLMRYGPVLRKKSKFAQSYVPTPTISEKASV